MTYKFDPSKVLYFSLVPFEGEVSMENSEDGDYVTREDFEQLLKLYRDAEFSIAFWKDLLKQEWGARGKEIADDEIPF